MLKQSFWPHIKLMIWNTKHVCLLIRKTTKNLCLKVQISFQSWFASKASQLYLCTTDSQPEMQHVSWKCYPWKIAGLWEVITYVNLSAYAWLVDVSYIQRVYMYSSDIITYNNGNDSKFLLMDHPGLNIAWVITS